MKFRFKFVTFAVMLLGATSVFASTHVPYDDKSVYNRSAVGTSSSMPHLFSDRLLAHNEHHHGHDAPPPKPSHGHDAPPPKHSHGPMVIPPGPGVGPGPHPHH